MPNRVSAGLSSPLALWQSMDARPIHRGLTAAHGRVWSRPRPCRWMHVGRYKYSGYAHLTNSNTPHWHDCCMHAQESSQNTIQPVWKSRPYASPRIQIRTTRVLPRSLESSPAAHASNPRSDHHWLYLYRGVRYYDLNYSSPPFYNGRRFCPSPSSAPIV